MIYICSDIEKVIENVGTQELGIAISGGDEHVQRLELVKPATFEVQQLPTSEKDLSGQWRQATLYWVDPNHKEADVVFTKGGRR